MIANLDGIRQFQEISESDRTIDDLVLDEVQESFLASYLSERKTRSKLLNLVQDDDVLLESYLKLEARERAQIERWRLKSPKYLEGDYEAKAAVSFRKAPKNRTIRSWQFYKEVHSRKAIAKIIKLYIEHQPRSKHGIVPLTAWFKSYDPQTAQNLTPIKKGKETRLASPPASKHYQQYRKLKKKDKTTLPFKDWILTQLTPTTKQELQKTPYYTQTELTIEQIVQYYIQHQPTSDKGQVPITTWFQKYDPQTAQNLKPTKKGKTKTIATAPSSKYYQQYRKLKKKDKTTLSFEEWILTQLTPTTKKQLLQTPYYTQTELNVEQIVQLYIQHQPIARRGLVPITAWFIKYDPKTAKNLKPTKKGKIKNIAIAPSNKYYAKHRDLKYEGKTTLSFEEWILQKLAPEIKRKLLQTPYYTQTELTIEQTVQLYIQHQPTSDKGQVPITTWFLNYDPKTAKNLTPWTKGKRKTIATPPANKYYDQYKGLKKKGKTTLPFEEWILKQVSNDTKKEYRKLKRRSK